MYNIEEFFRTLKFLYDNPKATVDASLTNESFYYDDNTKIFLDTLKLDPFKSLTFPKDYITIQKALQARQDTSEFINKVIFPGSYAYHTKTMELFRNLLIDWASATKTSSDLMIRSSNVFSLNDDDIDTALKGFGVNFLNKKSLDLRIQRAYFLLALCDLYRIKGTPESIRSALHLVDCPNIIIREWWYEKNLKLPYKAILKGVIVKRDKYFDSKTNSYKSYDSKYDENLILDGDYFTTKLADIGDAHWYYKNEEILAIDNDPDTHIKLPSLTPYFGIEFYLNYQHLNLLVSVLERMLSEQFNSIISGNIDLVPKEIGVHGYNEELTEKSLWLEGYVHPLSLLETFLGFSYCQIRHDEYEQYTHFRNFLEYHKVDLSTEEYHYPWAYQELIYWCYKNGDMLVDGTIPLINVVHMYKPVFTNYYCSTNEIKNWWIKRPKESHSEPDHTKDNVPDVFFGIPFYFPEKSTNTFFDKILFYQGSRNINFKESTVESNEIIQDYNDLVKIELNRIPFDDSYKSYHSNNRINNHRNILSHVQTIFLNKYYNFLSDPSLTYLDENSHDGSTLTPIFFGKYPISKQWNWAVDDTYFYMCIEPNIWSRQPLEFQWEDGIKHPDDEPIDSIVIENNLILDNNYLYRYVSKNKWARHSVSEIWNLCESEMSPSGHFKETSNLAKKIVKAKITNKNAKHYHNNKDFLAGKKISLLVDPYFKNQRRIVTLVELEEFLKEHQCIIDENTGLIYPKFNYYYENNYIYTKVYCVKLKKYVWVRHVVAGKWDALPLRSSIYIGPYKQPNLDLTNRYDAERLLKGQLAINPNDTKVISGTYGDKILVCKGPDGYPQIYYYDSKIPYLDEDGNTQYEYIWLPDSVNDINEINIGINNNFLEWINWSVESESDYEALADKLLLSLSHYVKMHMPEFEIDLSAVYKKIGNRGIYKDIINFFKPKRARLLYFATVLDIDYRLNQILLAEEIEKTKIIHQIFDYTPRSDTIFIDQNPMSKNCYHWNDHSIHLLIPERFFNSNSTKAKYYIYDETLTEDPVKINGFYFDRPDLQISYPYTYNSFRIDVPVTKQPYLLNDHNICLVKILNDQLINGFDRQWILAPRKDNLHYCDAYFVCYDVDPVTGTWYNPSKFTKHHDGSQIIPDCSEDYTGDVDQFKGNWAVDTWYLYRCIEENRWVRFPYEWNWNDSVEYIANDDWTSHPILPNSDRIFNPNSQTYVDIFQIGVYIYQYLNINKNIRWIRYSVQTDFDCELYFEGEYVYRRFINNGMWTKVLAELDWTGIIGEDIPVLPHTSRPILNGKPRNEFCTHNYVYRFNQYTNLWVRYEVETNWINGVVEPFSEYSEIYECHSFYDSTSGYLYEYIEDEYRWVRVLVGDPDPLDIPYNVFYNNSTRFLYISYIVDGKLISGKKASESNWDLSSNGPPIWSPYQWANIKVIPTEYLESISEEEALKIVLPQDQQYNVTYDNYELQKENHWNIVHPRSEPLNSQKSITKTISNVFWETAFCKDIFNFRKIFPSGILGYPENITGCRITGYDGDDRNEGVQEESHSFWSDYPYEDEQCLIRDSAKPILLRQPVLGDPLNSSSDYDYGHIPVWWSDAGFDPNRYRSGPIHHRPAFIGILQYVNDCYPCRPKTDCCDYYDTCCFHDGPTNPQIERFDGTWGPGKYSDYDVKDLSYDIWSTYHKKLNQFITDPSLQDFYKEEYKRVFDQANPGSTYCNECSQPIFTPDLSFYTMPTLLKENGVYHNKLKAVCFGTGYEWLADTVWLSFKNEGQEPVELTSIGNLKDDHGNNIEFSHGYIIENNETSSSSSGSQESYPGSEIVHIFNRNNGYHYWEIRKKVGSDFETVLRSKLKKKQHTLNDLLDWNLKDFHVNPDKFLNGNDLDVAEDEWCLPTPIEETTEENQIVVSGKLSSSTWLKFETEDVPEFNKISGNLGKVDFIDGYLYYCVNAELGSNTFTWKKIQAESNWTEAQEPWIRPDDNNNPYGYMFMDYNFDYRDLSDDCYLYVYVDTDNHKGWVRHLVVSEFQSRSFTTTNEYFVDGNSIHRLVSNPLRYKSDLELPEEKFIKYSQDSIDYKFVCGNPIPYNETYEGIYLISERKGYEDDLCMCKCHIDEKIFMSVVEFEEDVTGSFVRVYISDPSLFSFEEIRYHKVEDDVEEVIISRINTPPNYREDPSKWYYYDTKYGAIIPSGTTRIGSSYYKKVSVSVDDWYT